MKKPQTALLELVYPFALALVALTLAVTFSPPGSVTLQLDILKPFTVQQPITNEVAVRAIFLCFALGFLCIPAFRSYCSYFPQYLKMRVFFNADGIERALKVFTSHELAELGIAQEWQNAQHCFIDRLNDLMREQALARFGQFSADTYGVGDTTFIVHATKKWQEYQISDAHGGVTFKFASDGGEWISVYLAVELAPSEADMLHASLRDIYVRFTKVIRPRFALFVYTSPSSRWQVENLVCATKLRFFPMIGISDTVYLVGSEVGLIPVAYAVYEVQ